MKILLDECVDWRRSRDLTTHEVKIARQMGCASIKYGELLTLVAAEFDAFVTVDRNLSFQQKLSGLPLAVIVPRSKSNRLADLRVLVPDLLQSLETAKPGAAVFVGHV